MRCELVELEKKAFLARDRGDLGEAIESLEELVRINPQWEHGEAFFNLAQCYEEIGDLQKAKANYLRALEIQPDYYIFIEGYAAFLKHYGNVEK
jgi:tetratricopeptide (TPR) repeat protein